MFVEDLSCLEAVVELPEELVEQVPLGLVVPVSGGAARIEVSPCAGTGAQRTDRPGVPDRGQAPVLDMPVHHDDFSTAGAGDRGGAGVGLQSAGVGEAGAVVSDLGEHPGAGQQPEPWEANNDLGVRVLLKMGLSRLLQLITSGAGGLELGQQRGQLQPHRVLHQSGLTQLGSAKYGVQGIDVTVDVLAASGFSQQRPQLGPGELLRGRGGGCGGQHEPDVFAGQAAVRQRGQRGERGRVVVLEQGSDLVAQLLAGLDAIPVT